MVRIRASAALRRVFALVGLTGLWQCSFVFDTNNLVGGASVVGDAMAEDAEGEAGGIVAPNDTEGGAGSLDGAIGDESDADLGIQADADGAALDAGVDDGVDAVGLETAPDAGADIAEQDTGWDAETAADAAPLDAAGEGGSLDVGLVAFYPFDEASGTTSADASGNGLTATMNGATFAPGLRGNAATMDGSGQYVSLPGGIVNGLSSFSISAWINQRSQLSHSRIFDFGTGTTAYMFFTPVGGPARFAIATGGAGAEQRIDAPTALVTGTWQHVVVTRTGTTGTLYVNGAPVGQNTAMTLSPSSLQMTTQNWLGRSQHMADPNLNGQIDEFRVYSRALSAAEVQQLFAGHE